MILLIPTNGVVFDAVIGLIVEINATEQTGVDSVDGFIPLGWLITDALTAFEGLLDLIVLSVEGIGLCWWEWGCDEMLDISFLRDV